MYAIIITSCVFFCNLKHAICSNSANSKHKMIQNYFFADEVLTNLTSDDYAEMIKRRIKDDRTSNDPGEYGAVTTTIVDAGTAHVSVLAPDGSAVSVTSTINQV